MVRFLRPLGSAGGGSREVDSVINVVIRRLPLSMRAWCVPREIHPQGVPSDLAFCNHSNGRGGPPFNVHALFTAITIANVSGLPPLTSRRYATKRGVGASVLVGAGHGLCHVVSYFSPCVHEARLGFHDTLGDVIYVGIHGRSCLRLKCTSILEIHP